MSKPQVHPRMPRGGLTVPRDLQACLLGLLNSITLLSAVGPCDGAKATVKRDVPDLGMKVSEFTPMQSGVVGENRPVLHLQQGGGFGVFR